MILPACSANKLLQEQLRERMGFKGIVITGTPPTAWRDREQLPSCPAIYACLPQGFDTRSHICADCGAIGMMTGNHVSQKLSILSLLRPVLRICTKNMYLEYVLRNRY